MKKRNSSYLNRGAFIGKVNDHPTKNDQRWSFKLRLGGLGPFQEIIQCELIDVGSAHTTLFSNLLPEDLIYVEGHVRAEHSSLVVKAELVKTIHSDKERRV